MPARKKKAAPKKAAAPSSQQVAGLKSRISRLEREKDDLQKENSLLKGGEELEVQGERPKPSGRQAPLSLHERIETLEAQVTDLQERWMRQSESIGRLYESTGV